MSVRCAFELRLRPVRRLDRAPQVQCVHHNAAQSQNCPRSLSCHLNSSAVARARAVEIKIGIDPVRNGWICARLANFA